MTFCLFLFVAATAAALTGGNGCGTWYIDTSNCSAVSASEYWTFSFVFTQGGVVGGANVTSRVQLAVTTSFTDRWGLYFNPATPNVCVSGSSVTADACGSFSSLVRCNELCDSSLNPICTSFPVTSAPGTSHLIQFGIRKNNNGSGPCSTVVAVFLPTSNGVTATCQAPLGIDTTCPGTLASGYAGPVLYSAAAWLVPSLVLLLLLLSVVM